MKSPDAAGERRIYFKCQYLPTQTDDYQDFGFGKRHAKPCFNCKGPAHYPFLRWDDLCICARCCHRIKNGLMADMVHLAAIVDLQNLGYGNETLARESRAALEKRLTKELEEMQRFE